MVGKEKHVVAVLHFTGGVLQLAFCNLQLDCSTLVLNAVILYTAPGKTNTGKKGEKECRKLLRSTI